MKNSSEEKRAVKLNLGSGFTGISGWINYDWGILPFLSKISPLRSLLIKLTLLPKIYDLKWPKIRCVDIRRKFPLCNKSVDFVYCSHVLEHFEYWQAQDILKECRRVIKDTGGIRIVVPDIERMIDRYKRMMRRRNAEGAQVFCRDFWGYAKDLRPKNAWEKYSRKFIRGHKWHYDVFSLECLLKNAGFSKIEVCRFRSGKCPDINLLDLAENKEISLYIEAFC